MVERGAERLKGSCFQLLYRAGVEWGVRGGSCSMRYRLLQLLQARFVCPDAGLECVMNVGMLFHKPHTESMVKVENQSARKANDLLEQLQ